MADNTDETPEEVQETPEVIEEDKETTQKVDSTEQEPEVDTEVTEEVPDDAAKEEVEEEFDVEEFKKQTAAEAKKEILDTLKKGFGLTEEDQKESEDDGLIPPWEKRGEKAPKSWKELTEYSADLSEWKRKKEDEEIQKAQSEQEKEAKEANKRWNDYWDTELDDLVSSGKIPDIKNENDPNDPGKKARVKLFQKMHELSLERQSKGLQPITSIKLIYYEHYDDEQPPGADAPVSFGRKNAQTVGGDDPGYSYTDIHGKGFSELKKQ